MELSVSNSIVIMLTIAVHNSDNNYDLLTLYNKQILGADNKLDITNTKSQS